MGGPRLRPGSSSEDEADTDTEAGEEDTAAAPPVFTELLELVEYADGAREWREVARWVKYEETVEEAGNRCGQANIFMRLKYFVPLEMEQAAHLHPGAAGCAAPEEAAEEWHRHPRPGGRQYEEDLRGH